MSEENQDGVEEFLEKDKQAFLKKLDDQENQDADNGVRKVPFETRILRHPDGSFERKIFINNELLDWSVDVASFQEAQKMGPMYQRAVKEDIVKHFTNSVSEFLGRKVTMEEIHHATKSGWI
jgi:hypothetical protein